MQARIEGKREQQRSYGIALNDPTHDDEKRDLDSGHLTNGDHIGEQGTEKGDKTRRQGIMIVNGREIGMGNGRESGKEIK
eukprot:6589143-Karenia_brevis.AAC.1